MSALYLRREGQVEGPLDPAEVRRRLSAGELPLRTMSWKTGEKNWTSLARRWPEGRVLEHVLGAAGFLLVLVLLAAVVGIPGRLFVHLPEALQTETFVVGSVSAGLVCAIALMAALTYHRWQNNHRLPLPYALCLLFTLLGGVAAFGLSTQAIQMVKAEDHLPNASISYDDATRVIRIHGSIGHHFSSDVDAMLRAHGDATVIVINSPGGLLLESFHAADSIRQAQLPLRVDGICASACGLMWAAVPKREMTASSQIGLHQNRVIVDLPVEMTAGTSRTLENRSADVLSAAGFTSEMLRHRAETPPGKMYWVTAVDVLTAGINARVLNEQGQTMDMQAIKWAVLTAAWGKGSLTSQLYQAIGAHEPALADTYENKLYTALRNNDLPLFRYEDRLMETEALRQALTQVSDQAVMDWARSRQQDLAEASHAADPVACGWLSGKGDNRPEHAAARKRLGEHNVARTLALMKAVPEFAAMQGMETDIRAESSDFSTYSRSIVGRLKQQGFSGDARQWSVLQQCEYANEFLLGAEQMPLTSGANLVRYAETRAH
jgi:hypothetical protein